MFTYMFDVFICTILTYIYHFYLHYINVDRIHNMYIYIYMYLHSGKDSSICSYPTIYLSIDMIFLNL